MSDPFSLLAQARWLATGASLDAKRPELEPTCVSESELDALVRDYYILFNEVLASDVSFLHGVRSMPNVRKLRELLYNLRTAANHADNPRAQLESARWRAQHESPQEAADALAAMLFDALDRLSKTAILVTRSPGEATRWGELVSVEVSTVFAAVCADLHLSFSEANRSRMVRLIEKRLEVQPRSGDRRTLVTEYCVQEVLADRRPLPVPYTDVLDSLGLIGKASAQAALLIAYSVAAIAPHLPVQAFLLRVRETWEAARR